MRRPGLAICALALCITSALSVVVWWVIRVVRPADIDVARLLLPENAAELAAIDPSHLPMKFKDHNLVFVSFDALQAAHVGCLGCPRDVTPTLDTFARHGFLFTNATSVASWTVPASMTWFTGVYPSEHRLTNKYAVFEPDRETVAVLRELSPQLTTLAEILKQNGYATGGFTGDAGVSGRFGFAQGFDVYFDQEPFGSMDQSIPRALDWLREHKDRKFFLFLHGYDAHGQNTPDSGFDYRFVDPQYDGRFSGSEQEQEALREEGLEKGRLDLRDDDVRFCARVYDEKIQRADSLFKHFVADFAKLGLLDKTLFVLTSDHGTEFYEHRRFDHGFTLYQEQLRVPLVIRFPNQVRDKIVNDRISSIDVMPTILDLLDVELPRSVRDRFRGASLVSAMKGESVSRDVYAETDYRQYTYKRSVITPDGWKLIVTLENRTRELYDLANDPEERTNLAEVEPKRADRLEAAIFAHFKSIGHDLAAREWKTGLNPVYPSQAKDQSKR